MDSCAGCTSEEVACCWVGAGRNDAACSGGKLVAKACSPRLEEFAGVGGTCGGGPVAAGGGAPPAAAGNAPEPVGETGISTSLEALKLRVACGLAANALPPKPSTDAVGDGGGRPEPEDVRAGTGGSAAAAEELREGPAEPPGGGGGNPPGWLGVCCWGKEAGGGKYTPEEPARSC